MKTATKLLKRWDVLLCLLMASLFMAFPEIDLWMASQFFDGQSFYLNEHPVVYAIYRVFAKIHFVIFLVGLVGLAMLAFRRDGHAKTWRKNLRFILLVLFMAPGLLVNVVLKDNSIGRARPVHIEQFGGDKQFTPAFVYANQCNKNCSFVSGHAAIGFFFIAFGWLFRCHKVFCLGVVIGLIVGGTRVLQGGHFLSDVVFSFWVVYFTTLICAQLYRFRIKKQPTALSGTAMDKLST